MKYNIGESVAAGAILSHKKRLKEALKDHYRRFGSVEQLKMIVELTQKVEKKNNIK